MLGRKRKEVEDKELEEEEEEEKEKEKAEDLDMEELESLMSLEMEEFVEPARTAPDQQPGPVGNRSADKRKPASTTAVERSSTSKRPRVDPRDTGGPAPVPSGGLLKGSTFTTTTTTQSLEAEERTSSIMRHKPLATTDHAGGELWPHGGPEEAPSVSRSQEALAVKDEDVSMVVVRPMTPVCNWSHCP